MRNDSLVKKVFGGWFKEEQGATDEVGSGTKEVHGSSTPLTSTMSPLRRMLPTSPIIGLISGII